MTTFVKMYRPLTKEQKTIINKEYYKNNKEKLLEKSKQWKENNKEKLSVQRKKYNEKNKEKIAERENQKHNCKCGGKFTHQNKSKHVKTKKHMKYIESL